MNKKIVAVCEDENCRKALEKACNNLGYELKSEIQSQDRIKDEVSISDIQEASIVLFAIDDKVENIENIERFIDCEYYEVGPKFIINDAESVMKEIMMDLN